MTEPELPRIDDALVRELIAKQFPEWAELPISKVRSAGTDNALFGLGEHLVVRLPRRPEPSLANELRWLPWLAPQLPLAVPEPMGVGVPDDAFPYQWAVYQWIDGKTLDNADADLIDVAKQLGRFVAALQRIDPVDAPRSRRAEPLRLPDDDVRTRIELLGADGTVDPDIATAAWEESLAAPRWMHPPVWTHGDLFALNLLSRNGRLVAVIDFGLIGVGDPACDLEPAWNLLTASTREIFRAESKVDDATWLRGRGWALRAALGAVHVYRAANHPLASSGLHTLTEITTDYREGH